MSPKQSSLLPEFPHRYHCCWGDKVLLATRHSKMNSPTDCTVVKWEWERNEGDSTKWTDSPLYVSDATGKACFPHTGQRPLHSLYQDTQWYKQEFYGLGSVISHVRAKDIRNCDLNSTASLGLTSVPHVVGLPLVVVTLGDSGLRYLYWSFSVPKHRHNFRPWKPSHTSLLNVNAVQMNARMLQTSLKMKWKTKISPLPGDSLLMTVNSNSLWAVQREGGQALEADVGTCCVVSGLFARSCCNCERETFSWKWVLL